VTVVRKEEPQRVEVDEEVVKTLYDPDSTRSERREISTAYLPESLVSDKKTRK